jgi:hypothetical protein
MQQTQEQFVVPLVEMTPNVFCHVQRQQTAYVVIASTSGFKNRLNSAEG